MSCGNCDSPLSERAFHGANHPFCTACMTFWADPETLELVRRHVRRPPEGTIVSLTFEPNGTLHNDVVLRVGAWAHRSDSYYHAFDHPAEALPGAFKALLGEPTAERPSLGEALKMWAAAAQVRLASAMGRGDSQPADPHPQEDKLPGVIQSIRRLLLGWSAAVEACPNGNEVYLPHDFSDQCTAWLQCTRRGAAFHMVDGWSKMEGYSVSPSGFEEAARQLSDFEVMEDFGTPTVIPQAILLADIAASRSNLEGDSS